MPTKRLVAALEVGGSHVTSALVDLTDPEHPEVQRATRADLRPAEPAAAIVERIAACADAARAPHGALWGVAIPGPFDYDRGVALFENVAKFDALYGLDLRQALLRRLAAQPADIVFRNDAEAFLRGEWLAGAARGHDRAVGLTLGTGIGSAFLADGAMVVDGPLVPPQGRVHRLEVDGAPLEDAVSSRAITRNYATAMRAQEFDVRELAARARAGDPVARTVFHKAFVALGSALAPWLTRFAPTVVVVGGSVARSWDLVFPPLTQGLRGSSAEGAPICVVRAEDPERAPLIGAAWSADRFARAQARAR